MLEMKQGYVYIQGSRGYSCSRDSSEASMHLCTYLCTVLEGSRAKGGDQ